MNNIFVNNAASTNKIRMLAEWVRARASKVEDSEFDVIRFIELELPQIIPGLYTHIESDDVMGSRRAFIADDPLGLVVAESIYESAANGCLYSAEVILHEVGHLFLHHKYAALGLNSAAGFYQERIKNTGFANSAEWQATTFALCFLYPFSTVTRIGKTEDISAIYKITKRQALRVLNHIQKLKVRQSYANNLEDKKWLKAVVKTLPKPVKPGRRTKFSSQLALFFGNGKGSRQAVAQPKMLSAHPD